jgi:hypothetical protein
MSVGGLPIQDHVDTIARDRAHSFRAAAEANKPLPGEKPIQTQKRILKRQADGTYVGDKSHGKVTAVVMDRRTGIAYEATNGRGEDTILPDELHPTLRENIEVMKGAARAQPGGGYPALDRFGNLDTAFKQEGWPEGTRPAPHFDNPLGHAEVKAANEALWAREEANERLRSKEEPELPTGPGALHELYSQTYAPFEREGITPKPYCANCDYVMGLAENYSGRYTGYPHTVENLTGGYTPSGSTTRMTNGDPRIMDADRDE